MKMKAVRRVGATLVAVVFVLNTALNITADYQIGEGKQMDENKNKSDSTATELATFGAGCFWGIEETFRQIEGVVGTSVGYMGGSVIDPTYKQVCADNTGHAEVTQVEFDPVVISYDELLELFWKVHDPTQVNRQGPDVGAQYRTAIFFHSEKQKQSAENSKTALGGSKKHDRAIATEITPAAEFWPAEEYHQRYLQKRGLPACGLK